jgi:hypothetical protein
MDPIKEIMTQGVMQVGAMNTQLASGMTTMMTQLTANMNMAASSFAAAAPDLSTLAPAGMPMLPMIPSMGGVPRGAAPAGAPPAPPPVAPMYRMRMIR